MPPNRPTNVKMYNAIYIGDGYLNGHAALVLCRDDEEETCRARFTDHVTTLSFGWHEFRRDEFDIDYFSDVDSARTAY